MSVTKELKPVQPQPGKPLYIVVRDRIRDAIDSGTFSAGEQMPSTKELSEQLEVSLVTAHRALQELVNAGVLSRSQGKGTFVHQRYAEGQRTVSQCRIGLVLSPEASLSDYACAQIMEGVRQAAFAMDCDLLLLRFAEDVRRECQGYLYLNPGEQELEHMAARKVPVVVVGGPVEGPQAMALDVDNVQMARQAVAHLAGHGHTQIGFVGLDQELRNSEDRWDGFRQALSERGLTARPQWVVNGRGWRLEERERSELIRMLSGTARPTAVFAAGYYAALDVYAAAHMVGLRIGTDVSVVGVDDPPSAALLSPPLTTMRQPLVQLGHAAVTAAVERVRHDGALPTSNKVLRAELVIRESSGPAANR